MPAIYHRPIPCNHRMDHILIQKQLGEMILRLERSANPYEGGSGGEYTRQKFCTFATL
ncbi:MAG: hypothetical protein LUD68_06850 [Rikenellaceae bacterium]|nr:hypothetical protein [Rikenellaceae bacterium]